MFEIVSIYKSIRYVTSSVQPDINALRKHKILTLRYNIRIAKDNTFFTVPGSLEILNCIEHIKETPVLPGAL